MVPVKFSNKQKRGVEKLTGRYWSTWTPEVLRVYFSYTDRGIQENVSPAVQDEYKLLMEYHHFRSITVEMWKQDFKRGILFLEDFLYGDYPLHYLQYVVDIYVGIMGWMPSKYHTVLKEKGLKWL